MAGSPDPLLMSQWAQLMATTPLLAPSSTFISATTATVTLAVPSGFNNIEVIWRVRASDATAAESLFLQMNGDTGNNYLWEVNQANNTTVAATDSGGATSHIQIGTVPGNSASANYFGSGRFTVSGASDSVAKTLVGTGTAYSSVSNAYAGVYSGLWSGTAAVTSLTIVCQTGSFLPSSRFSVYVSY